MAPPKTPLFDKTLSVIESCVTYAQLDAARNYLELYRRKEQDTKKYAILLDRLDFIAQKIS